MSSGTRTSERRRLLLILAICAGIYAPAVWNDFTYDDGQYVKAYTDEGPNEMVVTLHPFWKYFTKPYGYPLNENSRGFRPITVYTFALTHHAFASADPVSGGWSDPAWPHHLLNILLHLLGIWLVYRMTVLLTGPGPAPLMAALVFGVHALRTDVVISIVGRGELLGFVLGAAALVLIVPELTGEKKGAWRMVLGGLFLFLAFCSKENAVVWAAFIPLFLVVVLEQSHPGTKILAVCREKGLALFLVIAPPIALFFLLRHLMLAEHGEAFKVTYNANPLFHADLSCRLMTGTMLLGYALLKVFIPYPLACDYCAYVFRLVDGWTDPRFLGALAVLMAILIGGLRAFHRHRLLFMAATTFLGFSFLTSNIPVRLEMIFAERILYAPALGLSFAVAWAAGWLPAGRVRLVAGILAMFWLLPNAGLCVKRCFDWRNNETLFLNDVASQPRSLLLNLEAASIFHEAGNTEKRESYLNRAKNLDPESPWIAITMGQIRLSEGKLEDADRQFRKALASPKIDSAEKLYLRLNLGTINVNLGRIPEAKNFFETVRKNDSRSRLAHLARIQLFWMAHKVGDVREMGRLVEEGVKLLPHLPASRRGSIHANYRLFRGMLEHSRGRFQASLPLLGESLSALETRSSDPQRLPAVLVYVDALEKTGRKNDALRMVEAYLKSRALPAEYRPRFEAMQRRLNR